MSQITIDLPKALDHVSQASGLNAGLRRDVGLVIKTILTEAFGGPVLRPWRLQATQGRTALVIGYSDEGIESLRTRLSMALPSAQAAIGEAIDTEVPEPSAGDVVALELRLSPVVSVNRDDGKGIIRRDAYLRAKELSERAGEPSPTRDQAYAVYAAERLTGFEITGSILRGYRLQKHARRAASGNWTFKMVPEADLLLRARVADASAAARTVRDGVGRSRAFGCGMIRVMPASAARLAVQNDA